MYIYCDFCVIYKEQQICIYLLVYNFIKIIGLGGDFEIHYHLISLLVKSIHLEISKQSVQILYKANLILKTFNFSHKTKLPKLSHESLK